MADRHTQADLESTPGRGFLPLTGERTVPGVPEENYWFRRHEAAYQFLLPLARSRRLLEVGCGEGYGTAMLATVASRVVGIDYDPLTIAHAVATYPGVEFVRANLAALPVPDASIDVVATLQVIEHVWNHGQFVDECLRVLRPGGLLVVSTPNRLTFSPGRDEPVNIFHTKEFTGAELTDLLSRHGFEVVTAHGLHAGERLVTLDARHGGSFVDAQLASPPEDWPADLRANVASVSTADFPIDADGDLDAALDLIVVARRPVAMARSCRT